MFEKHFDNRRNCKCGGVSITTNLLVSARINAPEVLTVCVYYVTLMSQLNATADRTILLRFKSKNKGNYFISFLMKHGAVYAAYKALSTGFQRSLISGLVSSNTSMNLFSKFEKRFVEVFEKTRAPIKLL